MNEEKKEKAKSILETIKSFFAKTEKKIVRIRVMHSTQKFWVSDPVKIEQYRKMAKRSAMWGFAKGRDVAVRITKVVYEY